MRRLLPETVSEGLLIAFNKFSQWLEEWIPDVVACYFPAKLLAVFGLLHLIISLVLFSFLFVVGYQSQSTKVFLSPICDNLSGDSCDSVSVEVSGRFLATQNGRWQRDSGFVFSEAAYALTLSGYTTNNLKYRTFMQEIYDDLVQHGEVAKDRDLAHNLLYWMGWSYVDKERVANRMVLYGDPLIVFNRDSAVFAVSNATHDCTIPSTSRFFAGDGVLSSSMDVHEFFADSICMNMMSPRLFGYDTFSSPPTFSVAFDVRSFVVAVAVNAGIKRLDDLVEVATFRRVVVDNTGNNYTLARFYDPKYPSMDPVGCIVSITPAVCLFRQGSIAAIPFFHHSGSNLSFPTPCNCSTMKEQSTPADSIHPCNIFRFIAGFMYWNLPFGTGLIDLLRQVDIHHIHQNSFIPAFWTSSLGRNSPLRETHFTASTRRETFAFCTVNQIGACSIASFAVYDIDGSSFTISPDYLQLTAGACKASFLPNRSSWEALIESPYASLNQQYQECRYSSREVLLNQAGITIGNVEIMAPGIILFILTIVLIRHWLLSLPMEQQYSKAERDGALDDIAIAMLTARDQLRLHHDVSTEGEAVDMVAMASFSSDEGLDVPVESSRGKFVLAAILEEMNRYYEHQLHGRQHEQ